MNQWPQVLLLGGLTSDRARAIVSPRPRISGSFPGELALTDRTRGLAKLHVAHSKDENRP